MSTGPRDVFLRLVHGVAEGRFSELPDLYAEVTDVRHPMATPESEPTERPDHRVTRLHRSDPLPPGTR
jgi:hypothetical protein